MYCKTNKKCYSAKNRKNFNLYKINKMMKMFEIDLQFIKVYLNMLLIIESY
jgi:hypothetical protein